MRIRKIAVVLVVAFAALALNAKIAGVDREDSPTGTSIVQVIENLPTSDSTSGHGTHCAGIVGGLGNVSKTNSANDIGGYGYYTGVAPGAHLIGVGTGDTLFIFYARRFRLRDVAPRAIQHQGRFEFVGLDDGSRRSIRSE